MSELKHCLQKLQNSGEKALGIFVTSGFPTIAATGPILEAIDAGGADFIELGMPFSDPLAEGKTIQMSSAVALDSGVTMDYTFEKARIFKEKSDTPILLMGYVNPILQYGLSNFFSSCQSSRVSAVILPDLPHKTRLSIRQKALDHGIDIVYLVAPTTSNDRLTAIDELSEGFVYAVSMTGLTGTSMPDKTVVMNYLKRVRSHVRRNPVLVGFGISSADDIKTLTENIDGCIVGSALIRLLEDVWQSETLSESDRMNRVTDFVRELKTGTGPVRKAGSARPVASNQ